IYYLYPVLKIKSSFCIPIGANMQFIANGPLYIKLYILVENRINLILVVRRYTRVFIFLYVSSYIKVGRTIHLKIHFILAKNSGKSIFIISSDIKLQIKQSLLLLIHCFILLYKLLPIRLNGIVTAPAGILFKFHYINRSSGNI